MKSSVKQTVLTSLVKYDYMALSKGNYSLDREDDSDVRV